MAFSGTGSVGFTWVKDPSSIVYNMKKMHDQVPAKMRRVMDEFSVEVEDYMKENAPWNDRSGAARSSLTAEVGQLSGDRIWLDAGYDLDILLSEQDPPRDRDYSVFLEGYLDLSILGPTQQEMFPEILQYVKKGGFIEF